MRRALALLVLLGLATTALVAGTKVQAQRSETFQFATLKTWGWNPGKPGDVKVWLTAESKSEPVQRQYEPMIMRVVEQELTRRGYVKAAAGATPDFTVTYYVLITAGSNSQQMGQFLPATTQWALPPFTAQTQAFHMYPLGTLVLDVGAPDADHVVWRAVAQAEVELQKSDDKREATLRQIVKDVFAKLPRK
jgi:hypothetical protein